MPRQHGDLKSMWSCFFQEGTYANNAITYYQYTHCTVHTFMEHTFLLLRVSHTVHGP